MDLIGRLETELDGMRGSGAVARAFRRWREKGPGLARFGSPEELIGSCRAGGPKDWGAIDAALAELCLEARRGCEEAGTLLLWLLVPGLLRLREELAASRALPLDELDAELLAGLWEAACSIAASERRIARRLLNAARWRVLAAMRETVEWSSRIAPMVTEAEDPPYAETSASGLVTAAVRERVLSPGEARLMLASEKELTAAARELGIETRGAAYVRRHRLGKRLLAWVARGSREVPAPRPSASPRHVPGETPAVPTSEL